VIYKDLVLSVRSSISAKQSWSHTRPPSVPNGSVFKRISLCIRYISFLSFRPLFLTLNCFLDHRQSSFIPADLVPPESRVAFDSPGSRFQNSDISPNLSIFECLVTSSPPRPSPGSLGVSSSSPIRPKRLDHIPRPRNAFMIFRSEFVAAEKISRTVERDNRHISRIVGHCWNQMSEDEKHVWRLKAEHEKLQHMRKYPDYKFSPALRVTKPRKRHVQRNGDDEILRCRRVADLLLAGKEGETLARAIKEENLGEVEDNAYCETGDNQTPLEVACRRPQEPFHDYVERLPPPFRSPLLPPRESLSYSPFMPFPVTPSFQGTRVHPSEPSLANVLNYSMPRSGEALDFPHLISDYHTTSASTGFESTHSPSYLNSDTHPYTHSYSPTHVGSLIHSQPLPYPESPTDMLHGALSNLSIQAHSAKGSAFVFPPTESSAFPCPSFHDPFQSQPNSVPHPYSHFVASLNFVYDFPGQQQGH